MPYIDNYLVPIDATSDQNNWLDRLTAALERMESSSFYFSRKLSDDKRAVKVEIGKDRSRKIDISIPIGLPDHNKLGLLAWGTDGEVYICRQKIDHVNRAGASITEPFKTGWIGPDYVCSRIRFGRRARVYYAVICLSSGDKRIADDASRLITGLWSHDTEAPVGNPAESADVVAERRRRMELWEQLRAMGHDTFAPSLLNDLRIFYGGRGIWVHQDVTRAIGGNMSGVAVGLLHTGSAYADDLHHDGVIYHYPKTEVPGRDMSEINATKAAMRLRIPVFVISYPHRNASTRHVHLGWVDGFDDGERWFLVSFGQEPSPAEPVENTTFVTTVQKNYRVRNTKSRPGQQRFKFMVFKRYGGRCAVCDLAVQEALDAAHIIPDEAGGTDDPRNGILLCANHHRAFDRGLFGIRPETLCIEISAQGPSRQALRIQKENLLHLSNPPHPDALRWRWERLSIGETGA